MNVSGPAPTPAAKTAKAPPGKQASKTPVPGSGPDSGNANNTPPPSPGGGQQGGAGSTGGGGAAPSASHPAPSAAGPSKAPPPGPGPKKSLPGARPQPHPVAEPGEESKPGNRLGRLRTRSGPDNNPMAIWSNIVKFLLRSSRVLLASRYYRLWFRASKGRRRSRILAMHLGSQKRDSVRRTFFRKWLLFTVLTSQRPLGGVARWREECAEDLLAKHLAAHTQTRGSRRPVAVAAYPASQPLPSPIQYGQDWTSAGPYRGDQSDVYRQRNGTWVQYPPSPSQQDFNRRRDFAPTTPPGPGPAPVVYQSPSNAGSYPPGSPVAASAHYPYEVPPEQHQYYASPSQRYYPPQPQQQQAYTYVQPYSHSPNSVRQTLALGPPASPPRRGYTELVIDIESDRLELSTL